MKNAKQLIKQATTAHCKHCGGTGRQADQKVLGLLMRGIREGAGISLRAMAGALKVSAPFLSDLERGNRVWGEERASVYIEECHKQAKGTK